MKVTRGIAVALTAAILASGGGAASLVTAQPAQAAVSQPELDAAITQILNETNAERAKAGLAPLKLTPGMNTVAQNWSKAMADKGSMTHNPEYQWELPQPWIRVGENVGQGYTPSTIVPAWMASEGHKKNILGDFTHIGLGYYVDASGRGWFTQNFGKYDIPNLTVINEPENTIGKFDFTSSWEAKWDEPVDNYKAELYSADGTLLQTKVSPTPTVSFTGLTDLTTYTVKIVSQKTDAPGFLHTSPVKTYTVTTLEELPTVTAPTNLALAAGEDKMGVSWVAPAGYIGTLRPYKVELLKAGVVVASAETTDTNYTFNGLTSNTAYTVNVTATTAVRTKTATATATLASKTLLSSVAQVTEPTNVASVSESFSTVKATWAAPAQQVGNSLKYIVTLSTDGKPDVVVETTGNSYVFTGLKQNTGYVVKVQANITAENGINKSTTTGVNTSVKTLLDYNAVEVNAPTLKPVAIAPKSATLTWDAPTNVIGNIVDYTVTVKQAGQADRTFNTTNKTYVVTGLLENVSYTFSVKANAASLNGVNKASATSASATHTTPYAPDTVIVSAPNAVTVQAPAYNEVTASWTAPSTIVGSVTGYQVTLKDGTRVVSAKTVTTLNTNFTGLDDYTNYTVEVTALATSADKTNNTTSSVAKASVKTPSHVAAPNAPTALKVDAAAHDKATVSWTAPTGVYGTIADYTVTLKQAGKADRTFKSTGTSYEITGLTELSSYTVQVVANAVAKDGVKTATSPLTSVELTTPISPSTVKVTAPTNLVLSQVAYDSMKVSWTAPTGTIGSVYGYQVTVKDGATVVSSKLAITMSTTVTGLKDSTNYTVEVAALASSPDKTNNATSPVVSSTAKTPAYVAAPNAPTELKASAVTDKTATLSWTAPTGVYGTIVDYTVTLKESGKADRVFKSAAPTFEITGLTENNAYTADVVANVVSRDGSLSATSPLVSADIKTPYAADSVKVSPVTDVTVSGVTQTSLNVAWTAPAEVVGKLTGYTVLVKQGATTVKTYSTTGTSYAVTGLNSNTAYAVEVQANAVSANGLKQATSSEVAPSVTTPKSTAVSVTAPTVTVANVGSNGATVTWTRPTSITGSLTGYKVIVKQGTTVVKSLDVPSLLNSTPITGLDETTAYTVTVEANAVAEDGVTTAKATSAVKSFNTVLSEDSKVSVGTPVSLATSSTLNSVTATWSAPAVTGKLTNYTVTLKKGATVVETKTVTDTTATFIGLTEDTAYTVDVVANGSSINDKFKSSSVAASKAVSTPIDVDSKVAVGTPALLTTSSTFNSVTANWVTPAVTGKITGYTVTLKLGNVVVKTLTTTQPSAVFTGLAENTGYTVQVVASATSVNGKNQATSAVATKDVSTLVDVDSKVSVGTPSVTSSSTANSINAAWKAPAVTGKITDYTVTLKQGNTVVKTQSVTSTSAVFAGLAENTSYTVSVVANATSNNGVNKVSSTPATQVVSTLLSADSKVAVSGVVSLITSSTTNSANASWKAPAVTGKITDYTVTLKQGNTVVKTQTVTGTNVSFTGLQDSTAYTVTVVANATSVNGKFSASSTEVTASVTTARGPASQILVGTPTSVTTTVTANNAKVSWKPSAALIGKITGYTVTLKQGNTVVKSFVSTSTTASFSGLKENTAYTVFVITNATSANGKFKASSYPAVKNFSTPWSAESRVSAGVPSSMAVTTTPTSVTATWVKPAITGRLTSYTVTLVKGGKTVKTIYTTGTRTTFSGLTEKTGYVVYVKANAISLNGKYKATSGVVGKSVTTATSTASKVSAATPASLAASSTRNTVTATWNRPAITGILTSYTVTLKKGNTTVLTYYTTGTRVTFYGLSANTGYTVSVKANAKSSNGKYKASSGTTSKAIATKR